MPAWVKACKSNTVTQVMQELSGCTEEQLLHPAQTEPGQIHGLAEACAVIRRAIDAHEPVSVFGDYDADGVTAAAILYLILSWMGAAPVIRLPHRMSEGYGLSVHAVQEIYETNRGGLLITVDNGIAAHEAIRYAKELGFTVVVVDHHLPDSELPQADAILDLWVGDTDSFRDFCGAGLAYKIAEYLLAECFSDYGAHLTVLAALAAVGTVADVVPLHGDNRAIVIAGLQAMRDGCVSAGMRQLLTALGLDKELCADDVAFKLAPVINAAGRMRDNGAKLPCALLSCLATERLEPLAKHARSLVSLNELRKDAVKVWMETIHAEYLADIQTAPITVFLPDAPEGIVGILAGKLMDEYKVPAFVFTLTRDGWKGSARSVDGVDIKERLDSVPPGVIKAYGGHTGAAGLLVEESMADAFRDAVRRAFGDVRPDTEETVQYHIEAGPEDVERLYREIQRFQPFGAGCPEPAVMVHGIALSEAPFYMGKDKTHLRLTANGFSVVAFSMAERFKAMGEPDRVDVVGRISVNRYKGTETLQIVAEDIRPAEC